MINGELESASMNDQKSIIKVQEVQTDNTEDLNREENLTGEDVENVIGELPDLLQECLAVLQTSDEKLMGLYSVVGLTGAVMSDVWINYDNKINYPALMMMIVFPPASSKGSLSHMAKILYKIDQELVSKSERDLADFRYKLRAASKKGSQKSIPEKPPRIVLMLPGNTTSAKIQEQLHDNDGKQMLVIFETEADAYGITSSTGTFGLLNSTILRQAFHHERISSMRKGNDEYHVANTPKLVVVLSGTQSQVATIFKSSGDGLLSRFMFVLGEGSAEWKDVKPCEGCKTLDEHFNSLADKYYSIWKYLSGKKVEVKFTDEQWNMINRFGEEKLGIVHEFTGENASSIVKRHGNMITRIAAILTMVRYFERKDTVTIIYCNDSDFQTSIWMVDNSLKSTLKIYKMLPGEPSKGIPAKKLAFLKALPASFKRIEILKVREKLGIKERTCERWLNQFVSANILRSPQRGHYEKTKLAEMAVAENAQGEMD